MSVPIASHGFALVGQAEGRPPVKRSFYAEHDYAFGQLMLTLWTTIGLTQAGLADLLETETVTAANSARALQQIVDGVAAGRYRVSIDRVFHFNELSRHTALWRRTEQRVSSWWSFLFQKGDPEPLQSIHPNAENAGT
jgi:hypothetical protein